MKKASTSKESNSAVGTSIYHVLEQMYMDYSAMCDRMPKSVSFQHCANRILQIVCDAMDCFIEAYGYEKFSVERYDAMKIMCQRLAALRSSVHLVYLRTKSGSVHPISPEQLARYDETFFNLRNQIAGLIRTTCVSVKSE